MRANQNHVWDYVVCCINYTRKRIDESSAPTWKKNKTKIAYNRRAAVSKRTKLLPLFVVFCFFRERRGLRSDVSASRPSCTYHRRGVGVSSIPFLRIFTAKEIGIVCSHAALELFPFVVSRREFHFSMLDNFSFFSFFQLRPRLLLLPPPPPSVTAESVWVWTLLILRLKWNEDYIARKELVSAEPMQLAKFWKEGNQKENGCHYD